MTARHLLLLAGDGIGAETMAQVERVLTVLRNAGLDTTWDSAPLGGASLDLHGTPLTAETLARAKQADAVLLGAVGGPKWENLDFALRPEQALLTLRKELGLFANLRPAICFPALAESSSLRSELISGLDLLIVRELTGGVYFGEPRGIETLASGERRGVNTQTYTTSEILRVAEIAFTLAAERSGKLVSVEKSNVMESGVLWREEVTALHQKNWQTLSLSHMYADNCAMQLVRAPKQFDVILTDNLFGDLLSDVAAMLTGSLGMLPSASLGDRRPDGLRPALYEPVHGSAPDIAGKSLANPCASLLSLAMALRWSFARPDLAEALESAVEETLAQGFRTPDLMTTTRESNNHLRQASTTEMTDKILDNLG